MPENKPWEDVFDEVFPFNISRQLSDEDTKVAPVQSPEKDDDGWNQTYNTVHAAATPEPASEQDEWGKVYDSMVGPAAGKGPMAEKFLRGTQQLIKQPERITGGCSEGFYDYC